MTIQELRDKRRDFVQAVQNAVTEDLTVMTFPGTPDHESHDRFPLPRPLPREGGGEITDRQISAEPAARGARARTPARGGP